MKRGVLPLNALRAFEAAARLGRMVDAAEELGVTHGAISRQIRGLEEILGTKLLEGPRNRPVLTREGQALLPSLTAAFDGIEQAVSRLIGTGQRPLDVNCIATFSMRWLIPRLYDLQARHPGLEVRLSADDGPVELVQQRYDVVIRVAAEAQLPQDAMVTRLVEDRMGPVLSPGLRPAEYLRDWRDLVDLPRLQNMSRAWAWQFWAEQQGCQLSSDEHPYEHFYFMLEAAVAGLGVAMAPEVLVRDDLKAGRLIAPFSFIPSGMHYVAVSAPQPRRDIALFMAWLEEQGAKER